MFLKLYILSYARERRWIPTPSLFLIRASNAAAFHSESSYPPVAVFVGGTSGIGKAMVERFARFTKGNSSIIIVGRNRAAAEAIFASLPSAENSAHEFIQCDASLMSNVHTTSQEILSRYDKINYLILTPGVLNLNGREETSEGIDKKLAVHYYARWRFIYDLLPSLERAKEAGEEAKTLTVLAAGKGGEIDVDDLGLKKSFSLLNASMAAPTYTDLMMEVIIFSSSFSLMNHTHLIHVVLRFSPS
jgi:NAD(P)-dependent dehydrogenase (short-subunit alcohol dehydrogenase family)